MNLIISSKKIFKANIIIIFFLSLMNVLGIFSSLYLGHGQLFGFVPLFNFDTESNIPTVYSSLLLFFAGIILFLISNLHRVDKKKYYHWIGLALIFTLLSVDELVLIHERFGYPFLYFLGITSGFLYYAWVVPYIVFLLILAAIYLRFILSLPKYTMKMFILSGTIFIIGAMGLEIIGGYYATSHGWDNLIYSICYTIEEILEMLGVSLFILSLFNYIATEYKILRFSITFSETVK